MESIDIGKVLHNVASRHNLSITKITKKAGYNSQSTFYKHTAQANLSFKILYRYAKAMNYYFTSEIPEFEKWLKENGLIDKDKTPESFEELRIDRDNWRNKYYQLLEKYNTLLEDKTANN